jgi:hypothetical protein
VSARQEDLSSMRDELFDKNLLKENPGYLSERLLEERQHSHAVYSKHLGLLLEELDKIATSIKYANFFLLYFYIVILLNLLYFYILYFIFYLFILIINQIQYFKYRRTASVQP